LFLSFFFVTYDLLLCFSLSRVALEHVALHHLPIVIRFLRSEVPNSNIFLWFCSLLCSSFIFYICG